MLVLSIIHAVQKDDYSIIVKDFVGSIIASDNQISGVLQDLAEDTDDLTFGYIIEKIMIIFGSLYFFFYLFVGFHNFIEKTFIPSAVIIQTFPFFLFIIFMLKIIYFSLIYFLAGEIPYTKLMFWKQTLPLVFLIDMFIYGLPILERFEPIFSTAKNVTDPFITNNNFTNGTG